MWRRTACALGALAALAACGDDSGGKCTSAACRDAAPDDDGGSQRDARVDRCTDQSCGGVEPICDSSSGLCRACQTGPDCLAKDATRPVCLVARCVECATSADCTTPTRPFCDVTLPNHCRSCARDSECGPSGICDESLGTCVGASGIVYVSAAGVASGTCGTQAAPCRTLGQALPQVVGTRKWVLVGAGTYAEAVSVTSQTVNLVGPGAILAGDGSGAALTIGGGAHVTAEGFVISASAATADGVSCSAPATNPGELTLRSVVVEENAGLGLRASGCTVSLDRAILRHNLAGGVLLSSSSYSIVNSFIVDNGTAAAALGGVRIDGTLPTGAASLSFTTIADNHASGPSGIQCAATPAPPAIASSIVWGNGTMGGSTGCSFASSDVQGGGFGMDPLFVNAAGGDYHLTAASPCKDAGDNLGAPSFDFDGDPRPTPIGGTVDIGADEVAP